MRRHPRWLGPLTPVTFGLALGCFAVAGALALQARQPSLQAKRSLPLPDARALALVDQLPKKVRARQMPRPVRVVIPAIGVSAPVIPLHLQRNRTLQVPKIFSQAGWFVGGPEPGENGAAIIVAHVD